MCVQWWVVLNLHPNIWKKWVDKCGLFDKAEMKTKNKIKI